MLTHQHSNPRNPERALKTTLKTKVKTRSMRTGLKKDHASPIREPR